MKERMDEQGKPLEGLEGLTEEHLQRFQALWITTSEQLLSLSATPGNRRRLATYLGMSEERFETLLALVRTQLLPEVAEEMERPVRGGFLGEVTPIPPDKRRGRWPSGGKTEPEDTEQCKE
ncbi:MAG: hypothetical protein QHJ81_07245 [Anaerolineae bacterium]|nr:hypothetical protein [Anaerolineae bacterium]